MSDRPRIKTIYACDMQPGSTFLHPGGFHCVVHDTQRTGENRIKMTITCVGLKGKSNLTITVKPHDVFVDATYLIQESPL